MKPRPISVRNLLIGAMIVPLTLTVSPIAPALAASGAVAMSSDTSVEQSNDTTVNGPDATTNDFLDLERSLTECISSNPPPGCGRTPTSPGDRGGWQQLVLFGVMMSGIGVIFWRVSRAVRRRDAIAHSE